MLKILKYLGEHKGAVFVTFLFLVVQAACEITLPQYTADIVDVGIQNSDTGFLKDACLKMTALSVLMMLAACSASFMASRTGAAIGRDLRGRVFRKVVSFSGAEIDSFSTASLITRCTNDVQQITMVCIILLRMVFYAPIIGAAGIVKVMSTKTGMSWIIALAVVSIMLLISLLMSLALPKFRIMQTLVDRLNLVSREILTGVSVIRAFNRQDEEEKRFEAVNKDLMKTQIFANRVMTFMMPSMMLIMNCVSVLVVWAGSNHVDAGNLEVGDMIAFITYAMMIVMAFMMITMISIFLPRAGVAAERINEVLNTESSINDADNPYAADNADIKGEISFENVSFRYPGAQEDMLHDVSFTAEAHKTTAIIGSTGSGKSTLINLIPRFYDVTEGRILLDGTDIRDITQKQLRDTIGFVPQKGILFSGTIESNLKYADENISDEMMKKAAETAQAVEFIDAKPEGYKSSISQNGSNVSGGQRQRLAIARAVAKQPKIYLFDDSFSALDFKTDAALRRALAENTGNATNIIVAQRISTIMHADKIIVLDEGRVAGIGTHDELMKECEEYREIAKSQLSQAELEGGVM
jgi:ATP-binding cassette subfamily B protein